MSRKKGRAGGSSIRTFNIEEGMPSVEEARKILLKELRGAAASGVKVMKLIHGYGSSGKGGKLRIALRKSLTRRRKEGVIAGFIPGERFSIYEEETCNAIAQFPQLKGDSDLGRSNEGITIVLIGGGGR